MNLSSVERQFKETEKREVAMRGLFDPLKLSGKKHIYIHDLKTDYEFDSLIYGFDKYVNEKQARVQPQHLEPLLSETPAVKEDLHAPFKRQFRAKLRDSSMLRVIKPLDKEQYKGLFSETKIVPPEVLNAKKAREEKALHEGEIGPWSSEHLGEIGVNPAAEKQVRLAPPLKAVVQSERQLPKAPFNHQSNHLTASPTVNTSLLPAVPLPAKPEQPVNSVSPSAKVGPDEPLNSSGPRENTLVLECAKVVQSPFSDSPIVHYITTVPRISIRLRSQRCRDLRAAYTLQLTDLSVPGYPQTQMTNLVCYPDSPWVRDHSGSSELDLGALIKDYGAVHRHTLRLVLLAQGGKRRLVERLIHFAARDWKSEAKVTRELTAFAVFLRSRKVTHSLSPNKRKVQHEAVSTYECLANGQQRVMAPLLPCAESMKTVTPRRLRPLDTSVTTERKHTPSAERTLPSLATSKSRPICKHPITNALLSYREDDFMYRHEHYAANLLSLEDWAKCWKISPDQHSHDGPNSEDDGIVITGRRCEL